MTVDDDVPFVPHNAPCEPGIDGYRQYKCRCDEGCKAANAKYSREVRARAKAKKLAAVEDNVRPLRRHGSPVNTVVGGDVLNGRAKPGQKRLDEQPEIGYAERSVMTVCKNNPDVADELPDVVAQARIMARLLDNPAREKEWTSASRQLNILMAQLRPVVKTKSKGRLVAIRKMTNRVSGDDSTQSG